MRRDEVVTRLVVNLYVSPEDRRTLGAFISRDELIAAIERELDRHSRFPAQEEVRFQIVAAPTGTRLVTRRFNSQSLEHFRSVRDAIERYIDLEIGPSCGGVLVR